MAAPTTADVRPKTRRVRIPIGPGGPWHRVPARVWRAYQSSVDGVGWNAWRQHLTQRPARSIPRVLAGKRSPIGWAVSESGENGPSVQLVERLYRQVGKRAANRSAGIGAEASRWLAHAATAEQNVAFGLECLAWCWALPSLAAELDERTWWNLLVRLVEIAGDNNTAPAEPLAAELLRGELPLALAWLFPELGECQALQPAARRTITACLRQWLDRRGMPHNRYLPWLGPLVACLTRCRALGDQLADGWCSPPAVRRYEKFVQCALRLLRADGRGVFAAADAPAWDAPMLTAAARLAGSEAQRILRLTTVGQARPRQVKGQPWPAAESEWAGIALARSDWTPTSPRLAVCYSGHRVTLEMSARAQSILSGAWELEVAVAGRALAPLGDWEQTCWITDRDVDYLELELNLSGQVTVQRQMVLLRETPVLYLADVVLGPAEAPIEYRGRLPLADVARFEGEPETRDGFLLSGQRRLARVMPLALGEWRTGYARGQLAAAEGSLQLSQTAQGRSLYAPLFIDLDPARLRREATWRQLTVAADRQNVSADVAVGYRVQCHDSQWLVYRSLAAPAVRSVLSKSLLHEFLFGNFLPDGKVEELVEIDIT